MKERRLTCIGCPMGCQLTVTMEGNEVLSVEGNTCPRGDIYARKEVTNPTRIVTSTIAITGGDKERISCKTATDVPKEKMFDVMKEISKVQVIEPLGTGDIVIENVLGLGVDVVITSDLMKGEV